MSFTFDHYQTVTLAKAVQLTPSSGTFYFYDPDNVEVLLKVLDACAINNRFWIFYAATMNVEFTLEFSDRLNSRGILYGSPGGVLAKPVADTDAFPCSAP